MNTGKRRNRTTSNTGRIAAVAYTRTSSAANIGADKDSQRRQRDAVQRFADRSGYVIAEADWFVDEAVSGADDLTGRPGFAALLTRIRNNGVRVVILEDASRLARKLLIQEAGIAALQALGVTVLASNGDNLTESDDEFRVAMRQIAGVFAELERSRLVKKLKTARDRKIAETGRCGGRIGLADAKPDAVALARKLRRANPITGKRLSYRDIADKLADAGHKAASGKPYSASVMKRMLDA